MIRIFFAFGAALLASTATWVPLAHATPETVIDIYEEPFGISATHLFLIRSSADNMGLYESLRSESFLVAVDLVSGEEEIWLLDRATRVRDYEEDGSPLEYVVRRDEGLLPVNPYTILADRGAMPWAAVSRKGIGWPAPEIARDPDADAITVTYAHGPNGSGLVYRLTGDQLQRAIAALSSSMARNVADRARMSRMSTRAVFAERFVAIERCKPDGILEYWAPYRATDGTSDGSGPARFMRITCSTEDDDGVTSLIVQLKPVSTVEAAD